MFSKRYFKIILLLLLGFYFSFDSNFGYFGYKNKKNLSDYISLSGTFKISSYNEDYLYLWDEPDNNDIVWDVYEKIKRVESGLFIFNYDWYKYGYIEIIFGLNRLRHDYDIEGIFSGNQLNINWHFWASNTYQKDLRSGLIIGLENKNDIFDWGANYSPWKHTESELSFAFYMVNGDRKTKNTLKWTGLYFVILVGQDEIEDTYDSTIIEHQKEGYGLGGILKLNENLSFNCYFAAYSYNSGDYDYRTAQEVSIKLMMDI